MSIPYPKKERAGPSPVSRIGLHIYRDPPAAKFTRKSEKVNIKEIMYMSDPTSEYGDPSRTNEAISYYARGKNPMVEVDYGAGQGASNPYKIEVVRPPLEPYQTTNAISRPDVHQNYAIQTNPFIEPVSIGNKIDRAEIAKPIHQDQLAGVIKATPSISYYDIIDQLSRDASGKTRSDDTILRGSIRPTSSYDLNPSRETNFIRSTAVGDANVYTVSSNLNFSRQTPNGAEMRESISQHAIQDLNSFGVTSNATFGNIVVFDPKTNATLDLASTVKDKHYIAVNAAYGKPLVFNTNDGRQIMLKDYSYSAVNTAVGNPQLIIQVNQPDVHLDRNTPLFTASSNLRGIGDADAARMGAGSIELEQNVPLVSVNAGISQSNSAAGVNNSRTTQDNWHLNKQAHFGEFNRYGKTSPNMRQDYRTDLSKKDRFNQTAKLGHEMNLARA